MSGAMSAGTIAALAIGGGIGAAGLGYSIYSGQKSAGLQQQALSDQENAQKTATNNVLSQQRKSDQAMNSANMKTPDIAAILARAADSAKGGVGSTMLTGSSGVNSTALNLGKSTLLGG